MTEADEKRLAGLRAIYAGEPDDVVGAFLLRLLDAERADRARVQGELQRISFASGNVGIEHPEWPPEYARHVAALIARATQAESALAAARERVEEMQEALRRARVLLHMIGQHEPGEEWDTETCNRFVGTMLDIDAALTPETP